MSDANVALVQRLYGAYQQGDFPTVLAAMDPAVDWKVVGQRAHHPGLGEWPGRDGVAGFFKTIGETVDFLEFTPEGFYGADDKVFVLGRYAFTDRDTGKRVDTEWMHVLTVQEGQIKTFREFTDTAQLAEARRA